MRISKGWCMTWYYAWFNTFLFTYLNKVFMVRCLCISRQQRLHHFLRKLQKKLKWQKKCNRSEIKLEKVLMHNGTTKTDFNLSRSTQLQRKFNSVPRSEEVLQVIRFMIPSTHKPSIKVAFNEAITLILFSLSL